MGHLPKKLECISGGVGNSERKMMLGHYDSHSLWLITAAKRSGEYLSRVKVKVTDNRDNWEIISCVMDGTWLFLDLPLGNYDVEKTYLDHINKRAENEKEYAHPSPRSLTVDDVF